MARIQPQCRRCGGPLTPSYSSSHVGRERLPSPSKPARLIGIDAARALAIVGMLAVHIGPTDAEGLTGRLYALPHGRASVVFVLLAGVGVSLLARSRRTSGWDARAKLLWRAALLLPVGLALQELDHGVLVILQEYALLFLLAALVLGLADRWLLALAGGLAVIGPVVNLVGQMRAPTTFERSGIALADPPGEVLHGLLLSGPYPLVVWAVPFLLGMWIGRRDLRSVTVRTWLVVGGGAAALGAWLLSAGLVMLLGDPTNPVGWDHLIVRSAHSQMPPWIVGATGVAALLLGACLAIGSWLPRLLWPLAAAGQLALTIYVGHLLALHAAPERLTSDDVGAAAAILLGFSVVAITVAVAWRALWSRGPLEMLLQLPWLAARGRHRA